MRTVMVDCAQPSASRSRPQRTVAHNGVKGIEMPGVHLLISPVSNSNFINNQYCRYFMASGITACHDRRPAAGSAARRSRPAGAARPTPRCRSLTLALVVGAASAVHRGHQRHDDPAAAVSARRPAGAAVPDAAGHERRSRTAIRYNNRVFYRFRSGAAAGGGARGVLGRANGRSAAAANRKA